MIAARCNASAGRRAARAASLDLGDQTPQWLDLDSAPAPSGDDGWRHRVTDRQTEHALRKPAAGGRRPVAGGR